MDIEKWFKKTIEEIAKLNIGNEFEVKNLFLEYEWEALSKGERIQFGKHFKSEVLEGRVFGVRYIERKINNHAKYKKIEEKTNETTYM